MARVMSHDAFIIDWEVYDFIMGQYYTVPEAEALGLLFCRVPLVLTFPGVVHPSTPTKIAYEKWSVPSYPEDGTEQLGTLATTQSVFRI